MRLLVVEDDESVASFIQKGFQEERYAVDVAADGAQGQLLACSASYDAIILDIMLPKVNGLTLCRTLRDQHIRTPVLLLTVRDSVSDKVHGLDSGADDYLTKPFAFAELLARVRALLRRSSSGGNGRLQAADLELDTTARRCGVTGRS